MDIYEKRQALERRIVRAVVTDAVAQGYSVTVFADDSPTLSKSTNVAQIMASTMTTDEDVLIFYKDNTRVGYVYFIYGNDGHDVIHDHTGNDVTASLLKRANDIADKAARDGR